MNQRHTAKAFQAVLLGIFLLGVACSTNQIPEQQAQDAKVTTTIKAKLASNVRVATLANVDVNTTNGVVTLSGSVSSEDEKKSVVAVVTSVPGVKKINNNLVVVAAAPS